MNLSRRLNKSPRLFTLTFSVVIITLLILYMMSGEKDHRDFVNKIKEAPLFTYGFVLRYSNYKVKYALMIDYQTTIETTFYSDHRGCGQCFNLAPQLFTHPFPVIYNKNDKSLHRILIVPDDFKEFGIPYPDSLNWVREILGE